MALDNDQIICKLLRDEWSALKNAIEAASTILRKIYDRIMAITQRLKNAIVKGLASIVKELYSTLRSHLGLDTLSNNLFRTRFCEVMYKCRPMIRKLASYLGEDFYSWLYGPDPIKFGDLSKYGLPADMKFTSKYEAFEYFSCRLSLRGLLQNTANGYIDAMSAFIGRLLNYCDPTWWLKNSYLGRLLERMIRRYENIFKEYVLPYMERLGDFMDCPFALCDFKASTKNFMDDFRNRYKVECKDPGVGVTKQFNVMHNELSSGINDSLEGLSNDLTGFQKQFTKMKEVQDEAEKQTSENHRKYYENYIKGSELEQSTTPENSEVAKKKEENRTSPTSVQSPMLADSFNTNTKRTTIVYYTPTSERVA
jgi:hypothetical protein